MMESGFERRVSRGRQIGSSSRRGGQDGVVCPASVGRLKRLRHQMDTSPTLIRGQTQPRVTNLSLVTL